MPVEASSPRRRALIDAAKGLAIVAIVLGPLAVWWLGQRPRLPWPFTPPGWLLG